MKSGWWYGRDREPRNLEWFTGQDWGCNAGPDEVRMRGTAK